MAEQETKVDLTQDEIYQKVLQGAGGSVLTEDMQSQLSYALFPDTHTTEVDVLGKKRTLRPLPLKYSRLVHSITKPISQKMQDEAERQQRYRTRADYLASVGEAFEDFPPVSEMDGYTVEALMSVVLILCDYYKWDDIKEDIETGMENENSLRLRDLQSICSVQTQIQEASDFLLDPLRIIIIAMQQLEIMRVLQSTRSLRRSSTSQGQTSSESSQPTRKLKSQS